MKKLYCEFLILPVVVLFVLVFLLSNISVASAQGVCAHRGEHVKAPENTIPSIKSAVDAGVHQIEIDVKSTLDSVEVLMHDWTVDRTTDGSGKVSDLTFEEIRALDAGSWFSPEYRNTRVPTLQEALLVIPDDVSVNVHVHGGIDTVVRTAKIIEENGGIGHCFLTLGMDNFKEMAAARLAVPSIKLCKGHPADSTVVLDDTLIPDKFFMQADIETRGNDRYRTINYFQLFGSYESIDQLTGMVKKLHDYGVIVNYCCANSVEQVVPLIKADVDYILTDNIKMSLKALKEYKPQSNDKIVK